MYGDFLHDRAGVVAPVFSCPDPVQHIVARAGSRQGIHLERQERVGVAYVCDTDGRQPWQGIASDGLVAERSGNLGCLGVRDGDVLGSDAFIATGIPRRPFSDEGIGSRANAVDGAYVEPYFRAVVTVVRCAGRCGERDSLAVGGDICGYPGKRWGNIVFYSDGLDMFAGVAAEVGGDPFAGQDVVVRATTVGAGLCELYSGAGRTVVAGAEGRNGGYGGTGHGDIRRGIHKLGCLVVLNGHDLYVGSLITALV